MNKKYEIQCIVSGCTTKRGRKESVPIHRFPKRGDAGQRWIEACANPSLSRLEYRQVVERKSFVCHRHFDEQYFKQKGNGAFLLKCDAVPTKNLPSGSDVSSEGNEILAICIGNLFSLLKPKVVYLHPFLSSLQFSKFWKEILCTLDANM